MSAIRTDLELAANAKTPGCITGGCSQAVEAYRSCRPARISLANAPKAVRANARLGESGFLESRTAIMVGSVATSTQLPPSESLRELLRQHADDRSDVSTNPP